MPWHGACHKFSLKINKQRRLYISKKSDDSTHVARVVKVDKSVNFWRRTQGICIRISTILRIALPAFVNKFAWVIVQNKGKEI